ncbi:MAG: 30S ribosomal protein S20 [Candidatus Margulisiibacteriota bacterium]|jgi:small subunit ribosomal protein S20
MANLKSSKKSILTTKRNQTKNSKHKNKMKTFIKKALIAIEDKEVSALELVTKSLQVIDKTAGKGVIKRKTAARKKSKLMKFFNKSLTEAAKPTVEVKAKPVKKTATKTKSKKSAK